MKHSDFQTEHLRGPRQDGLLAVLECASVVPDSAEVVQTGHIGRHIRRPFTTRKVLHHVVFLAFEEVARTVLRHKYPSELRNSRHFSSAIRMAAARRASAAPPVEQRALSAPDARAIQKHAPTPSFTTGMPTRPPSDVAAPSKQRLASRSMSPGRLKHPVSPWSAKDFGFVGQTIMLRKTWLRSHVCSARPRLLLQPYTWIKLNVEEQKLSPFPLFSTTCCAPGLPESRGRTSTAVSCIRGRTLVFCLPTSFPF